MNFLTEQVTDFSRLAAAGLYRVTPERARTLREAAHLNGCCVRDIDLGYATDKHTQLAQIAIALDFPDWFGHNWDALADCMSDLSWLPQGTAYVFVLTGVVFPVPPVLLDIFAESVNQWRSRRTSMWILLIADEQTA